MPHRDARVGFKLIQLFIELQNSLLKLRQFFEVDRYYVTVAALKALADEGTLPPSKVADAMKK